MAWLSEQYGNLASVLGLVFSIAALWVASRTRKKVDASRNQLLAKFEFVETFWAVSSLESALAELNVFCETRNWTQAADRCRTSVRLLGSLKDSEAIEAPYVMMIRRGIEDLNTIMQSMEAKSQRKGSRALESKKKEAINRLGSLLRN